MNGRALLTAGRNAAPSKERRRAAALRWTLVSALLAINAIAADAAWFPPANAAVGDLGPSAPAPSPAATPAEAPAEAPAGSLIWDRRDCRRPIHGEPTVHRTDFEWGLSTDQFRETGRDFYRRASRLGQRFHLVPNGTLQARISADPSVEAVAVPRRFVLRVKRQLETFLALGIVDHLALSDLGHAHLYVSEAYYAASLPPTLPQHQTIERILTERPHLLYHSAERLAFKGDADISADPYVQVRFYTRNVLGLPAGGIRIVHNINDAAMTNTVQHLDGLQNTGQMIHIHANRRGCFYVRVNRPRPTVVRFDLSFIAPNGAPGFAYDE